MKIQNAKVSIRNHQLKAFERIAVARTTTTWLTDGSLSLQLANPSNSGVKIPAGLVLGHFSTVNIISPSERHVHAVAANPVTPAETATARADLEIALAKAFQDTTFTPDQVRIVLDLCAKYRSVFSLSPEELGCCTIAEATFPLPPGTTPVDKAPYRTSPHVQEKIDAQVNKMLDQDIIEERTSSWGSPCCIVARPDGTPRFCVDYRHTLNRHIIRKSWPMLNAADHLDAVGGAKYISVCDILSAFHQLPVATADVEATAFTTQRGKYCFKRMPFGVCNAPWLFQRMMALAFHDIAASCGLLCYVDDIVLCTPTFEAHITLLARTLSALQKAGPTLKPSKVQFGKREVTY